MNKESESCSPTTEQETVEPGESFPVRESADVELCRFNPDGDKNEHVTIDTAEKLDLNVDTTAASHSTDIIEIPLWKYKKLRFNKCLITLRIAQFLWFGGARIPTFILPVFLKQRGVSLVELSSVYSLIVLVQSTSCFISGIVADKIGNAKPVLMFLMLATSAVIVCMLFGPSGNAKNCIQINSNCSHISENGNNFTYAHSEDGFVSSGDAQFVQVNCTLDNLEMAENYSSFSSINMTGISCSKNCSTPCSSRSTNDCSNGKGHVIIYAAFVLCLYSVWSTAYRFMDFTAISLANRNDSSFGKERFVGNAGEIIIAILAGFVFNLKSSSSAKYNYDSMLWVSASTMFLAAVSVYNINTPILPPGRNLTRKAFKLIRNRDVLVFVIIVFVAGNGYCFNSYFRMWFLETLNAPKTLITLVQVSFSLYAIPMLLTSSWWLKKLGTAKIFVLGLMCYGVNYISYSFLHNSWLSLIIEGTTPFAFHLFWVALVEHGQKIAPIGFGATVNAMAGAFHFGLGRSSGVPGGGLLVKYFGLRIAYRIVAVLFFLTALLYSIFLYRRQTSSAKENKMKGNDLEETKNMNNGAEQDI